jgi:hypothetical protein
VQRAIKNYNDEKQDKMKRDLLFAPQTPAFIPTTPLKNDNEAAAAA